MGSMESGPALPPAGDDDTPAGLPGRGGSDGFGGFGRSFLSGGVGRGQANKPEDIHRVSGFLAGNGILPAPTDTADEDFFRAVEKGQDRLNELAGGGLRRDGIVKPWGPTEILSQRAVSSGKMRAPDGGPAVPAPGIAQLADARKESAPPEPPRLPPLPAPRDESARIRTEGMDGPREETPLERKARLGAQGTVAGERFNPTQVDPDAAGAFMRRLQERRTTAVKPEEQERAIPVTIGGYQLTRESGYLLQKAMTATPETRAAAIAEINKSGLDRTQKGALSELITRRLAPDTKDPIKFGDRKVISRLMSQMDERNAKSRDTTSRLFPFLPPTLRMATPGQVIKRRDAIGAIIRETIKKQVED